MSPPVTPLSALPEPAVAGFLRRYGLGWQRLPDQAEIPGSYWGAPEAGLVGNILGPIVVAMVADGVFSGHRALANALSLVSSVYGAIGLVAAVLVYRAIRRQRPRMEEDRQ